MGIGIGPSKRVTVDPLNVGSDRGLIKPALDQVRDRMGRLPERYLADAGFGSGQDIEWAHGEKVDARWHNWNLIRLPVRGRAKVKAVPHWYALADNILQGSRLMRATT